MRARFLLSSITPTCSAAVQYVQVSVSGTPKPAGERKGRLGAARPAIPYAPLPSACRCHAVSSNGI